MSKRMCLVSTLLLGFLFDGNQSKKFSRYTAVEAYEVRRGILMMPKYSDNGQPCEIVLEKNHYSDERAILDSTIPRETIIQILDDLVPPHDRGTLITDTGNQYLSAYSGNTVTTFADYENVSIRIFGLASPVGNSGDVVAVLHWNNRRCR